MLVSGADDFDYSPYQTPRRGGHHLLDAPAQASFTKTPSSGATAHSGTRIFFLPEILEFLLTLLVVLVRCGEFLFVVFSVAKSIVTV